MAEPARPVEMDLAAFLTWSAEVAHAGRDCRSRLAALGRLVTGE